MLGREEISALVKIILRNKTNERAKLMQQKQTLKPLLFSLEDEPAAAAGDGDLTPQEVNVITGVLSLSSISVRSACVHMSKVNMLASDQLLNQQTIDLIHQVGHSRLPVFR